MKVPKQAIRLGIAVALLTCGGGVIVSNAGAGGAHSSQGQPQQSPPIILVCPQGPPFCPFTKIQDAINAAPDGSTATGYIPPTTIVVAPGIYEENLIILKSVILQGSERDRVILRPRAGVGRQTRIAILAVGSIGPVYVQISGFTIQETSNQGGTVGIHLVGRWVGALIYNNRFQNSDSGIYLAYADGSVLISSNLFEGGEFGGAGISVVVDSTELEISGNTFLNLNNKNYRPADGIYISGSRGHSPKGSEIVVTKNILRNINGHGIVVADSAGVEVRENTIEGSLVGIYVYDSDEAITVQNNLIRSNRAHGISVSRSNVLVKGNRVEENQGHGIEIMKGLGREMVPAAQLLENQIFRNMRFGIWAERAEYVTVCRGNQVSENKAGDYGSGSIVEPQPSQELKQKCEGN